MTQLHKLTAKLKSVSLLHLVGKLRNLFQKCRFFYNRERHYFRQWIKSFRAKPLQTTIDYEKYFTEGLHSNYDHFWILGGLPLDFVNKVFFKSRIETLQHLLGKDLSGIKLLDLGCSGGAFLMLAEQYGCKTYGLDISREAIEYTRKHTHATVCPCDLSSEEIPFAHNFFDVIVAFDVLEHIKQVPHLFSEVQRVLKPGGFFYFITPNGHQSADKDQTHFSLKTQAEWEHMTKRYFTLLNSHTYDYYPPPPYLLIQRILHLYNRIRGTKIQQVVCIAQKPSLPIK